MINKKHLSVSLIVSLLLSAISCTDQYTKELNKVQQEIDDFKYRLDAAISQINSDINSLSVIVRALGQNNYITSIEQISMDGVNAYRICFFNGEVIMVHDGQNGKDGEDGKDGKDGEDGVNGTDGKDGSDGSNGTNGSDGTDGKDGSNGSDGKDGVDGKDGADGYSPRIGVKQGTDGKWYWTVDDNWLLDESGNRICLNPEDGMNGIDGENGTDGSDGCSPILKIENNIWYISIDGGNTWDEYGPATGAAGNSGKDGVVFETVFDNIIIQESSIVFYLKNGSVITVPMFTSLNLILDQTDDISIKAGGTVVIHYEVTGCSGEYLMECMCTDAWKAVVAALDNHTGTISVTAPNPFVDDNITVLVGTKDGGLAIKTLSFIELAQ